MIDMEAGNYESPASEAGYTDFSYTGGTVASIFDEFYELYDTKRMYDGDGDDAIWTTTIPVYGWDSCDNPRGMIQTTGFATVEIHTVIGPPTMEIVANVVCELYASGRSQGNNFGTMGTIPGLVQ